MIDTGFDLHVDMLVDRSGERPSEDSRRAARHNLKMASKHRGRSLRQLTEKWIDVTGQGYEKNWMWVLGAKYSTSNRYAHRTAAHLSP